MIVDLAVVDLGSNAAIEIFIDLLLPVSSLSEQLKKKKSGEMAFKKL